MSKNISYPSSYQVVADMEYLHYVESQCTKEPQYDPFSDHEERDDIKNIKTGFEGLSAEEIKVRLVDMGLSQEEIDMLVHSIWDDHH